MGVEIVQADVREWARDYSGEKFHCMLTDPPYHLTALHERWSKAKNTDTTWGQYGRLAKGFMGQEWDGTGPDGKGIAFDPATWAALAAHLLPGAWILAFASSRGWHRQAVAMEDAGLRMHPSIFCLGWLYSTGFCKATRIDTQVDAAAGAEREVVGERDKGEMHGGAWGGKHGLKQYQVYTAPATEPAKVWENHRYGGQVLSPSLEPILCFQKPWPKGTRPVDEITRTGAGALNIAAGRVGKEKTKVCHSRNRTNGHEGWKRPSTTTGEAPVYSTGEGRWPSNFCLADPESAAWLNQRGPQTKSGKGGSFNRELTSRGYEGGGIGQRRAENHHPVDQAKTGYPGEGGVARFFPSFDWSLEIEERLAGADPVKYTPKPGRAERDRGLDGPEVQTQKWNSGGIRARREEAGLGMGRNSHPTVKPLTLCKWLCSLLLPPPEYSPRRILIPFSGSGTECAAAYLAGWDEVVGVEQSEEFCALARARLRYWQGRQGLFATAEEGGEDVQGRFDL